MRAGWWVLALGVAGCTAAAPAGGGGLTAASTAPAAAAPSAGAGASPVASAAPAEVASPSGAPSPVASTAAGVPKVPSFALQVAPVVESKCALCHSSRSPRFVGEDGKTSHALFVGTAVRAHARAADGSMPPAGPKFTAEEVALLKAWIDAGSPNN